MSDILDNFESYKSLTESKQWKQICDLSGFDLSKTSTGSMKELRMLSDQLQGGEVVLSMVSGIVSNKGDGNASDFGMSTWLCVLTDRRFLFLDAAMLSRSIDVHSILHKNVQGVRVAQGFLLGKLNIDTGSRTTLIDNCDKKIVKIFSDRANEWLQVIESGSQFKSSASDEGVTVKLQEGPEEGPLEKLKKLGELRDLGYLSEQEFLEAKSKILSDM
jgi:hypothetical protein